MRASSSRVRRAGRRSHCVCLQRSSASESWSSGSASCSSCRASARPRRGLLELRAQPVAPRGPETGFDERAWLARQGIHVVLRGDDARLVGRRGGIGGVADRLHAHVEQTLARGTTGERRAVLTGIVLGEDDGIDAIAPRRLPGERADAPACGVGAERRDHRGRCRLAGADRGDRPARRRGPGDPRRAGVRARGRLAALGRACGGRRNPRVARVDHGEAERSLARDGGRRARAPRMDAVGGARPGVPAVVRGGRGHLRRRATRCRRAGRVPDTARALGRARRRGRVRARDSADRLAPLRRGRALDRAGERRRGAGDAAADRTVADGGGDRAGAPRRRGRARVAGRWLRGVDRARRADRERLAVGADPLARCAGGDPGLRRRGGRRSAPAPLSPPDGGRGPRVARACDGRGRLGAPAGAVVGAPAGPPRDVPRRRPGRLRAARGSGRSGARRRGAAGGGRRRATARDGDPLPDGDRAHPSAARPHRRRG